MNAAGLSIHDLTRRSTTAITALSMSGILSIHDLTRRSTDTGTEWAIDTAFQFTTSQGGRHCDYCAEYVWYPFNSRPHKEVDGNLC